MPTLVPTHKFLEDLEKIRRQPAIRKKVARALAYLETNPLHPGLHLERIVNDPSAWSVRVDRNFRISLDPKAHLKGGNPDWTGNVLLLRLHPHDDLYRTPR